LETLSLPTASPAGFSQSEFKRLLVLAIAQALNASAMPIGFIAGSLTAVSLAGGNERFAGMPAFISLMAASVCTFYAGKRVAFLGYRRILQIAGLLGVMGFALAAYAATHGHLVGLLLAYAMTGPALGLFGFARFAAAEGVDENQKARAMGKVVLGSTVGAILGPWLITLGETLFAGVGLNPALGPWVLGCLLYALATANITWFLPTAVQDGQAAQGGQTAKTVQATHVHAPDPSLERDVMALLRNPRIALALLAGVAAQAAMVFIMAITPLHMRHCHQSTQDISWVLSAHFLGMFAMSFISGWLADIFGRPKAMALGSLILLASCVLAPFASTVPLLMLALFLLGWGWSLCFMGVSATMLDGLAPGERGRLQGVNEALLNFSSSLASLLSGVAFAAFGYTGMAAVGFGISLLPLLSFAYQLRVKQLAK
jgi:predicted MFS family arabinose efflux permease